MPKSRNRRKKKKNTLQQPRVGKKPKIRALAQEAANPTIAAPPPLKLTLRERLFANDGEPLFQFISVLPLFFGTWIATGLHIENLPPFGILAGMAIASHYHGILRKREQLIFSRELHILYYVGLAAAAFAMYVYTGNIVFAAMTGVLSVTYAFGSQPRTSVPGVLLECVLVIVKMSVLSLLAISVQTVLLLQPIVPHHAVFGFVPGCMLAASLVSRYSAVFMRHGWRNSRERVKKDGSTQRMPGGVSRLFGLLLMCGPAVPLASAPFGEFPVVFFVCALPLYLSTKVAEAFFLETIPASVVTVHTIKLSGVTAFLLLIVGITLRLTAG